MQKQTLNSKKKRGTEKNKQTEGKGIATIRHELFIGHNKSDGADNVHSPCSHI